MTGAVLKTFPEHALRAKGLACYRGGRQVFEDLSFTLGPGDIVFLKGKNGSGKSTLLRVIAGLVPAESDGLSYGEEEWHQGDAATSETLIYSGHDHGLKPALTLAENCQNLVRLMTGAALDEGRLVEAAEVFDLTRLLYQPVRYFSSGQRHRSNLMRFLVLTRPIWLMDEPTVGLDAQNRTVLAAMIERHQKAGGMALIATHDEINLKGKTLDMKDFQPKKPDAQKDYWL